MRPNQRIPPTCIRYIPHLLRAKTTSSSARVDRGGGGEGGRGGGADRLHRAQQGLLSLQLGQSLVQVVTILSGSGGILSSGRLWTFWSTWFLGIVIIVAKL